MGRPTINEVIKRESKTNFEKPLCLNWWLFRPLQKSQLTEDLLGFPSIAAHFYHGLPTDFVLNVISH